MLKIQLCHHRNKMHFKISYNRKTVILNCKYFQNITVFTCLLSFLQSTTFLTLVYRYNKKLTEEETHSQKCKVNLLEYLGKTIQ